MILLSLFLVFAGMVGLDQVSKIHAHKTLLKYEDAQNVKIYYGKNIPIFSLSEKSSDLYFAFNLHYSRNTGAAFSMFADLPDWFRVPFFYGVTIFAVIIIFAFFRSTPVHHHFTRFGLIMIASGAVGNFLDRFRLGYVIDFIDVDWNLFGWRHDFAIFNVADVAINIGVIMLLIDFFTKVRKEEKEKAALKKES